MSHCYCPYNGLALATYGENAEQLVTDFNKGFDAIKADATFEQICDDAATNYGSGDPQCID